MNSAIPRSQDETSKSMPEVDAPRSHHNGEIPLLQPMNPDMPWFTHGDFDSFFMLFFDNLATLLLLVSSLISIPSAILAGGIIDAVGPDMHSSYVAEYEHMIYRKVLPGVGFALVFGNMWYGWMARKLGGFDKRVNVTAQPYGVNAPAGILMTFSVVLPLVVEYMIARNFERMPHSPIDAKEAVDKIWKGAVASNFVVGLLEIAGAWFGPVMIRHVPLAALLTPIAAIGFVWLAMDPFFQLAGEPIIGWPALMVAIAGFWSTSKGTFSFSTAGKVVNLPVAFCVIAVAVVLYWGNTCHFNHKSVYNEPGQAEVVVLDHMGCGRLKDHKHDVAQAKKRVGENKLTFGIGLTFWKDVDQFVGLVIPVAIASVVETLEDWELAKQAGDTYNLTEQMVVDGLGTCVGAVFGSILPTTVYLGHPIHKRLGATSGYSMLNAVVFFFLTNVGLFPLIGAVIPYEAMAPILMVVGLMTASNVFEVAPKRHYACVFIGLFCVIADWYDTPDGLPSSSRGILSMGYSGGIMNALVLCALLCDMVDRKYLRAAVWAAFACWCSLFGVMHANNLQGHSIGADGRAGRGEVTWAYKKPGNEGWRFAVAYAVACAAMLASHALQKIGLVDPPEYDDPESPQEKLIAATSLNQDASQQDLSAKKDLDV